MGRHAAPTGNRPAPQESRAEPRSAHSHRAHRATARRRPGSIPPTPATPGTPPSPAAPAVPRASRTPATSRAADQERIGEQTRPSRGGTATLERPAPQQIATVVLAPPAPVAAPAPALAPANAPEPAPLPRPSRRARRQPRRGLAARVAALPRVLLETVAWGGFAAVVALIVIALSDVGMGRAALWAVGLSGIVVLAVAVMAVTGTHLDELGQVDRRAGRLD